jgi:putative membrane protein
VSLPPGPAYAPRVKLAANAFVVLVALLHVYFFVLETFLFDKPIGLKTFGITKETATQQATLFKNQGVYNSFLAAGLFASLVFAEPIAVHFKIFFLACVTIAGIVGGATAAWSIFFVQSIPAIVALGLVLASR